MIVFERYFQYDPIFDISEYVFPVSWRRQRQLMDTSNETLCKYLTKFI